MKEIFEKVIKIESSMPITLDDLELAFGNGDAIPKLKVTEISQPSISAEEFIKEKKKDLIKNVNFEGYIALNQKDLIKLFTEFASRQGKVVEPINDKGDKCSGCGHYFTDKYNFCPNCGSKIVWK